MSPGQSEIIKLKELLKKLPQEKNDEKKREVLKKVIAYMTLGIDVSKLFPEMIMLSSTNDIIQKKMIYLYLNNYAESNSELSLLTINTLQKDSKDEDPTVRGLALRSFCNLRINNLLEYIESALYNGLNDKNPYVKRIAITSCIKLLKMNPKISIRNDIIRILKNMLLGKDTQSIVNAIHALNEILIDEGGLKVNKEIIFNILNRLSNFNEWGKCVVLNTISTYIPENEDEMYDIMNILENHIRDFSSAVFLSCLKCFLKFAENDEELQIQIFERMKDPLLTLISTSSYEISYVVLLHTYLLLNKSNKLNCKIFDLEYKHFFFRFNDLTYIKMIKLDILVAVASKNNAISIVNELREYVSDPNFEISQKAVASVGLIALKIPKATARVVELAFSTFLSFHSIYINNATLKILVSILRTHEEYTKIIIEKLFKYDFTDNINDDGLISYVWIVGEYCDYIENAPYILEEYVNIQNGSYLFMSELLSACLKVLPKRPAEMKIIISNLFENIIKNYKSPELIDKLVFYHKMLCYNYEEAFAIIRCKKKIVKNFCESSENILLDKLYNEFNTLSVMYKKPVDQFASYSKMPFGGIYVQEENKKYSESENEGSANYGETYGDDITTSSELMERNFTLSSNGLSEKNTPSVNIREHENLLNINEEVLTNHEMKHHTDKRENIYKYEKTQNEKLQNEKLQNEKSQYEKLQNEKTQNKDTRNGDIQSEDTQNTTRYNAVSDDNGILANLVEKNEHKNQTELKNSNDNNYTYNKEITFEKIEDMLIHTINLTPDIYQEKWNMLQETNNEKIFLTKNCKSLTIETIEELISKYNLTVLASGEIEHNLKFYIYAQLFTKHFIFIELIFNSSDQTVNWILKTTCDNESVIEQFADHFRDIFISFM